MITTDKAMALAARNDHNAKATSNMERRDHYERNAVLIRALVAERDEAHSKLARVSDLRRDENTYVIPFEYDDDQPGILVADLDAILDRPADAR